MQAEELLSRLEGLAEQLHIPVRYASLATEELAGHGGLCILRGTRRIIIERTLGCREKVRLLAEGLGQFERGEQAAYLSFERNGGARSRLELD